MEEKDFEWITCIEKISMNKNDILVLRLDMGNLPRKKAEIYSLSIIEKIKVHLPDNKVMVLPHSTAIDVITMEDTDKPNKSVKIPDCEIIIKE